MMRRAHVIDRVTFCPPAGMGERAVSLRRCLREVLIEDRGEVTLTEARHDDDDRLACVLLPSGHLQRRLDRRAGGDPDEQPFARRDFAGAGDGGFRVDVDDLVVDRGVENLRHEVRPEPLDLVRSGFSAVEDGGFRRLDGNDLDIGLTFLEYLAHTGDGAAGADSRDDDVDRAVRVPPDLLRGGLAVDLRVRFVRELPGEDRARSFGGDLLRAGHRTLHPLRTRREHELRSEGAQQGLALLGHRVRHREHDRVPARRAHEGEGAPRVPTRRLDDRATGLKITGRLGCINSCHTDAVLHAVRRVIELEFRQHGGVDSLGYFVQAYERGVTYEIGSVFIDSGHGTGSFLELQGAELDRAFQPLNRRLARGAMVSNT